MTVHIVPKKLNRKCPSAALRAAMFPLSAARIGVMVVPMLLPSTIAQAMSKGIQPLEHMMSTIANVAADDWIIIVTTRPAATNIITEANPREA